MTLTRQAASTRVKSVLRQAPVASSTSTVTTTIPTALPSPTPTQPPATVASSTILPARPAVNPTVATVTPAVPNTATIQVSGSHLVLNGAIYRFTGVNAYEAGTDYGTNAGCGADLTDAQLNQLFTSLPPNSLVRIAALQGSMATNFYTHQIDWDPLNRVFDAAAAHGQRLIVTIANQGGTCDNMHWEDPSWYNGGFMDVFNDPTTTQGTGLTPLSYWTYMQDLVTQYRNSPALGMWEPMSEPSGGTCPPQFEPLNCGTNQTCPDESVAATALRHFFDVVGTEIHTLDPNHLVESGMLSGGQCGTGGSDFQYVSASPGIDVLSYHDYYGTPLIGGDQWNGLGIHFQQAAALDKPIIGGEMGILAGTAPGCMSLGARNTAFESKVQAQLQAGSSGVLAWDWVPVAQSACSYDIGPTDPLLQPQGALTG